MLVVGAALNIIVSINLFGEELTESMRIYADYINIFLFIFVLVWFFIYLGHQKYKKVINDRDLKIAENEAEIEELKNSIEREAAVIAQKHGRFSDVLLCMSLTDTVKKAIENIAYVDAIQIYKTNRYIWNYKHQISFTVNYFCGYAKPGKNINAIAQQSYRVPLDIYNKIIESTEALIYSEIKNDGISQKEYKELVLKANDILFTAFKTVEKELIKVFKSFFNIKGRYKNLVELLNEVDFDKIRELQPEEINELADCYMLFFALLEKVFFGYDYGIILQDILLETEKRLHTFKRTNFLTALLFDQVNTFMHTNGSIKSGRRYVTIPYTIANEDFLIMVALNNSFDTHEGENIELKIDQIIDAIDDVIKDTYNITETDIAKKTEKVMKKIEERIKKN